MILLAVMMRMPVNEVTRAQACRIQCHCTLEDLAPACKRGEDQGEKNRMASDINTAYASDISVGCHENKLLEGLANHTTEVAKMKITI